VFRRTSRSTVILNILVTPQPHREKFKTEIVSFKNEAFKVEKEWRVVVRQREFTKQGTDDGGKTPMALHFLTSHGMVVPYIKLIPTDPAKKLPIACV